MVSPGPVRKEQGSENRFSSVSRRDVKPPVECRPWHQKETEMPVRGVPELSLKQGADGLIQAFTYGINEPFGLIQLTPFRD